MISVVLRGASQNLIRTGYSDLMIARVYEAASRNELVGGAFVNVPSSPEARVLESKALDDFRTRLDAILAGKPLTKAASDSAAMVTAIHDASVHLGAQCVMEPDVDPDSGASDGANKAMALRLRLKAIRS